MNPNAKPQPEVSAQPEQRAPWIEVLARCLWQRRHDMEAHAADLVPELRELADESVTQLERSLASRRAALWARTTGQL